MSKLVNIKKLAEITGLSVMTIRRKVANHTIPYTRTYAQAGKLLFDADLVQEILRNETLGNLQGRCDKGEDTQEQAPAQNTSYLASLFKTPEDPRDAQIERDSNFGYVPMHTNKAGSLQLK